MVRPRFISVGARFRCATAGRAHPRCSTVRDGSRRALRSWGIVGINAQGEITFFAEDRSCPISNGDHCGAVLSSLPHRIQNREVLPGIREGGGNIPFL